jgi:glycosyltransferase involved in cell wall biosynthesis
MKLSVVIPVYNEAATIESITKRVLALPIDKEIIITDDGSTDGTREILLSLQKESPETIFVFFHEKNQGKGAAIRTALDKITGEVIVIQDADLEYHPEDYPAALAFIQKGWADAVYGSRFLGPHRVFLFWHYAANKFLTHLVNILANCILTDMETGFKMIKSHVLKSLAIRSYTFDFEVEVTIKLLRRGFRLYEIPITYTGRGYEEGKKIGWKDGIRAVWAILKWSVIEW